MAVDKLVDSTQLDADLASVANAIRTKGGTSAELAFPQGFIDAVNAIPTGGVLEVTNTQNTPDSDFSITLTPTLKKLTVNFTSTAASFRLNQTFSAFDGADELVVNTATNPVGCSRSFIYIKSKSLILNFDVTDVNNSRFLYNCQNLETVGGTPIDLSTSTASTFEFALMPKLKEIRFAKSSIPRTIVLSGDTALSTDSLVSIANGLDETATGQTLTYGVSIAGITGNVVDGVFIQSDQGAMTLLDFVTNVKGWSVT